ncbi:hypothetical protein DSO57_1011329 [Entomophthora muscae]|uniref:Uncharacterized protein n=1 Tax=Entomophthora muscae TaxID=34485 RepID=A0ACC2T6S2_9FUNG|nr:hypothetical protein DSO57_1011329 [Entomophthora muscae]
MKVFVWLLSVAAESKFEQIVTFGDGFSDIRRTNTQTRGKYPGEPYYLGRFSNGPVWTEYLADELNATIFNYAYGMARADETHYPGKLIFEMTDP